MATICKEKATRTKYTLKCTWYILQLIFCEHILWNKATEMSLLVWFHVVVVVLSVYYVNVGRWLIT